MHLGKRTRRSALTHPEHKEKTAFPVSVTRGPKERLKKHLTLVGGPIPSKADVKQSQITVTGTQMSTEVSSHKQHP